MYKLTAIAMLTTLLLTNDPTQYVNAVKLMKESKKQKQLSPEMEKKIEEKLNKSIKDPKKIQSIKSKIEEEHAIDKLLSDSKGTKSITDSIIKEIHEKESKGKQQAQVKAQQATKDVEASTQAIKTSEGDNGGQKDTKENTDKQLEVNEQHKKFEDDSSKPEKTQEEHKQPQPEFKPKLAMDQPQGTYQSDLPTTQLKEHIEEAANIVESKVNKGWTQKDIKEKEHQVVDTSVQKAVEEVYDRNSAKIERVHEALDNEHKSIDIEQANDPVMKQHKQDRIVEAKKDLTITNKENIKKIEEVFNEGMAKQKAQLDKKKKEEIIKHDELEAKKPKENQIMKSIESIENKAMDDAIKKKEAEKVQQKKIQQEKLKKTPQEKQKNDDASKKKSDEEVLKQEELEAKSKKTGDVKMKLDNILKIKADDQHSELEAKKKEYNDAIDRKQQLEKENQELQKKHDSQVKEQRIDQAKNELKKQYEERTGQAKDKLQKLQDHERIEAEKKDQEKVKADAAYKAKQDAEALKKEKFNDLLKKMGDGEEHLKNTIIQEQQAKKQQEIEFAKRKIELETQKQIELERLKKAEEEKKLQKEIEKERKMKEKQIMEEKKKKQDQKKQDQSALDGLKKVVHALKTEQTKVEQGDKELKKIENEKPVIKTKEQKDKEIEKAIDDQEKEANAMIKKAKQLEKKADDIDGKIKKDSEQQEVLKQQANTHEKKKDTISRDIKECKEQEIVKTVEEAKTNYKVVISDLENDDFEQFLKFKESEGQKTSAKKISKKTAKEMYEYVLHEEDRKSAAKKNIKESKIKKLYDTKDTVDTYLEDMVNGQRNMDTQTTHGRDDFGKFERTIMQKGENNFVTKLKIDRNSYDGIQFQLAIAGKFAK